MAKKELILIGAGGHCKSCIDVIISDGRFKIAGIIGLKKEVGHYVMGYKVIAADKDIEKISTSYKNFLITIGSIKDPSPRIEKFERLKKAGANFPVIVSASAHLALGTQIGEGSIIMHGALVNSQARVGKNCIINSSAVIEHDAILGEHCHVSTGSIVNGTCVIGNRVFIGSNSVVFNDLKITSDVIIGAGSVVRAPIKRPGTYAGNPARLIS